MKPTSRTLFLAVLVPVFCLLGFPANAEKVRIATGEWPPYISSKLKHDGLASHIIKEAFALKQIDVEYVFFPWARAMKEAELGYVHGTHVWFHSKERADKFVFSDPLVSSEYVFFHLKNREFSWQKYSDLRLKRIGISTGYFYGDKFENARKMGLFSVNEVASDEQNLKMLFRRRIDIVPIDPLVGYHLIHEIFPPQQIPLFTNHPKAFQQSPMHLMFGRKHPQHAKLQAVFNEALLALKKSGRWDQMHDDLMAGKYRIK